MQHPDHDEPREEKDVAERPDLSERGRRGGHLADPNMETAVTDTTEKRG